jgi:hypothetical protein
MSAWRKHGTQLLGASLLPLACTVGFALFGNAADHRDGPIFGPPGITITNSRRDLNDVFIFQAPGNPSHTVLVMGLSPFTTATTPNTFDQTAAFEFKIDNNADAIEDITFRVTFGPPDGTGVQDVTLRGLPATKFPQNGGILARGKTRSNLPVLGGGMFRAAEQDDPFNFDATGFNILLNGGPFPRPVPGPGVTNPATNFFGPNVNELAITLEVPTALLLSAPNNPNIGVWIRSELNGKQLDRMGRPAINTALIPPIPRGSNFPIKPGTDLRNAFNAGLPRNDVRDFRGPMMGVLQNVYGRNATDASALASFLLPDILTFNTTQAFTTDSLDANGFPNGRRLRDDVIDVELNLLTAGKVTTDNVPPPGQQDDNGDRITDGTKRPDGTLRPIAFPYIGPPNPNPTGVPGGNPPP